VDRDRERTEHLTAGRPGGGGSDQRPGVGVGDQLDEPVDADINFYFDPLCPFDWMTSKWVRQVAAQRDYTVDWRFISLRVINADVDCDTHFPAGYEAGHTAGLRLLRVAARTRAEHGRRAVGALYEAIGTQAFDSAAAPALGPEERGSREFVEPLVQQASLPAWLADALDDASWDGELRAETD
jgi:hypothetical protein